MFATLCEALVPGSITGTVFRAACAAAMALAAVAALLPWLVRLAARRRFADRADKSDSDHLNQLHAAKRSTPIVGGIAMVAGVVPATLAFADLGRSEPWLLVASLLALASLGLADDLAKTFGANRTRGLSARQKLVGQAAIGLAVGVFLLLGGAEPAGWTTLGVPFTGHSLAIGAVGFAALVTFLVTGSSNAVNLTDGLDGLAGGCALVACAVYAAVGAAVSVPEVAAAFGVAHAPGGAEVAVALSAIAGGLVAFLWFNRHPARVFMGDTGSLPLGGVLAVAAVLTRQELLLAVVGGVFVVEALSVMAQVGSFRLTGRRVLRCAPLHHHFEFAGWRETEVVNRFHAAALVLGLIALAGFGA